MATLKRKTNNGYEPLPAMVVRKTNAENGNGIGTCSTSSGTALVVSLTGYELVQNGFVAVTFSNDVPASATLNINGKGAKPIYYKGSAITADTIKADDTVMFCYNGSQYVVTSLGGGGGSSVYPEFVTISLTSDLGNSDSNLIGATVVVTDDDTSGVILSTSWQGEDISVRVDEGIDYTVTVGNVSNYVIRTNTQSYTAVGFYARQISFKYISSTGFVDLGLPSGTLWSKTNIGASSQQDYGAYFTYGNTKAYPAADSSECTQSYYSTTKGGQLTASYSSGDPEYDAAAAILGGDCRTPTEAEIQELVDNCNYVKTTVNSVNGFLFTSKIAGYTDKSIFFPLNGRIYNGTYGRQTQDGWYYLSTLGKFFITDAQGVYITSNWGNRYTGMGIKYVI